MREFVGIAFNELLVVHGEQLMPRAEFILVSSEPRWTAEVGGFEPRRHLVEFRLMVSEAGLRQVAEACITAADSLADLSAAYASVLLPTGE